MTTDLCGMHILPKLFAQDARTIFGLLHWSMATLSKYELLFCFAFSLCSGNKVLWGIVT